MVNEIEAYHRSCSFLAGVTTLVEASKKIEKSADERAGATATSESKLDQLKRMLGALPKDAKAARAKLLTAMDLAATEVLQNQREQQVVAPR